MDIDDFIWLPDILEKLAVKHHVTQDEVEEVFFNQPRYRSSSQGIDHMRTCTPQPGKRMRADTYSCSLFINSAIQR